MTASIQAKSNGTQGALQVNGVDAVVFDSTGITTGAGKRVAQVVNSTSGALATGTTTLPFDDTIPQNTEGDQYLSVTITPTNTNSKLEIDVIAQFTSNAGAGNGITTALFQDATASALAAQGYLTTNGTGYSFIFAFKHYMTAGTTSATTFKVRAGMANGTQLSFNGTSGARVLGGVMSSSITIKEYLP